MKTSILSVVLMSVLGFIYSFDWTTTVRKVEYNMGAADAYKKINTELKSALEEAYKFEEKRRENDENCN